MEDGESVRVEYFDGSTWTPVASFVAGTDFQNGTFYQGQVKLSGANYVLNNYAQFRIHGGAGSQVFVDEVMFKFDNGMMKQAVQATMKPIRDRSGVDSDDPFMVQVYPSPAVTDVTVDANMTMDAIQLYSVAGTLIEDIEVDGMTRKINVEDMLRFGIGIMMTKTAQHDTASLSYYSHKLIQVSCVK